MVFRNVQMGSELARYSRQKHDFFENLNFNFLKNKQIRGKQ